VELVSGLLIQNFERPTLPGPDNARALWGQPGFGRCRDDEVGLFLKDVAGLYFNGDGGLFFKDLSQDLNAIF
jgi:hypothetical protein